MGIYSERVYCFGLFSLFLIQHTDTHTHTHSHKGVSFVAAIAYEGDD